MSRRSSRHGFTLVELLVVIAVIAVLATFLIFPASRITKEKAQRVICAHNLKQISLGLRMYADDANDQAPRTPGTTNSPGLNWSGYRALIQNYISAATNAQARVFACPSDTFYYDVAAGFQRIPKAMHDQPPDYMSYAFNGGNARTNSNAPGIAGRTLSSIKDPSKTVLLAESPAFIPYSWHEPKPPAANGAPMFDDAMNMVSYVDGHVSYTKIHWGGNNPPGAMALHRDPPAGYDYKWSDE